MVNSTPAAVTIPTAAPISSIRWCMSRMLFANPRHAAASDPHADAALLSTSHTLSQTDWKSPSAGETLLPISSLTQP